MDFPVLGLHSGWHGDGDEGAARAHQFGRSLEDVAADDVEHHVHLADVLQIVGVQVEEGLRAEAERDITVVGSAGADHAGAHLSRELDGDRADAARGAVNEDGLAGREVGVVEQSLSCGQSGNGQRGGHGVVDVGREGGEVASLHRGVLGQGSVASPVGQSEHPLAHGEAGGSVPELDHGSGQLVPGDAGCPVAAGAIGPRSRPVELSGG